MMVVQRDPKKGSARDVGLELRWDFRKVVWLAAENSMDSWKEYQLDVLTDKRLDLPMVACLALSKELCWGLPRDWMMEYLKVPDLVQRWALQKDCQTEPEMPMDD